MTVPVELAGIRVVAEAFVLDAGVVVELGEDHHQGSFA